ncbi:MAG: deoxyhypusine synthase [Nanoarchaeota archaeon]|nr:deoxyhypusine synthase [Nanoarchaeota archaeon]
MNNLKPINQIKIKKDQTVDSLIKELGSCGFNAGKLSRAVDIYEDMIKDKDCKIFFGLAGALVPAGMKNIIIDLIENNFIDIFVTTGANLTHDLIEALGNKHYQGTEKADDVKLNKKGINRIYNVFMKNDVYKSLEDFFNKNFDNLKDTKNIREFLFELGKLTPKDSILNTCYRKNIPIFCPAISDSGIGLMVWNNLVKNKQIQTNAFDDLKEILDLAWTCKKAGVVYIGGGTPKNYIQQAMQFTKGAYYGIQITLDREETGGSSGAKLKESISWGKLNEKAKFTNVTCDATIALPLVLASLKSRF